MQKSGDLIAHRHNEVKRIKRYIKVLTNKQSRVITKGFNGRSVYIEKMEELISMFDGKILFADRNDEQFILQAFAIKDGKYYFTPITAYDFIRYDEYYFKWKDWT